jgi:SAM-dependent methyltransferase
MNLLKDWNIAVRSIRLLLGLPVSLRTEDRRVLEQVVFPFYADRADVKKILFVGCQWYTKHYQRSFFPQHVFWTMDPDKRSRKFGSRRHVMAPLENLDEFFPEDYFDLILCNGVYGYGLDASQQCELAFEHCHSRLRTDGHLVLGWNDVVVETRVRMEDVASLRRFRKFTFPAFGSWRYLTDTSYRHTYDFYVK